MNLGHRIEAALAGLGFLIIFFISPFSVLSYFEFLDLLFFPWLGFIVGISAYAGVILGALLLIRKSRPSLFRWGVILTCIMAVFYPLVFLLMLEASLFS